jgi:carbon monoxide dehydrogenase subunit G
VVTGRDARAWTGRRRPVPSATVSLADTVTMPVAPDLAWRHLQDIEAVAACIPGLVEGSVERVDDDTFRGTMRHAALGIASLWHLTAHIDRSESDRALSIHLDGREERLDLTLTGDARLSIGTGESSGSALSYDGDLTVTGRLAGAGGPIIERVVASIIERFVQSIGSAGAPAPMGRWARFMAWVRGAFSVRRRFDRPPSRP